MSKNRQNGIHQRRSFQSEPALISEGPSTEAIVCWNRRKTQRPQSPISVTEARVQRTLQRKTAQLECLHPDRRHPPEVQTVTEAKSCCVPFNVPMTTDRSLTVRYIKLGPDNGRFLRHRPKRSERCMHCGNCTKASPRCQTWKVCRRPQRKNHVVGHGPLGIDRKSRCSDRISCPSNRPQLLVLAGGSNRLNSENAHQESATLITATTASKPSKTFESWSKTVDGEQSARIAISR